MTHFALAGLKPRPNFMEPRAQADGDSGRDAMTPAVGIEARNVKE
jgi:hypothetical protein